MTMQRGVVHLLWMVVAVVQAHHTVLDGDGVYHLHWETRGDEITFRVEVATLGYVGFGLSPNGGMAGSDVVIGWVKDGKPYFHDRFANGNSMPAIDQEQNWRLVFGKENETHTVLEFQRKFDTCDLQDMKITNDTMRFIYAYNDEDPSDENAVPYHSTQRGTRSVSFLQPKVPDFDPTNATDVHYWDALAENLTITGNQDTTYWCKVMRAPTFTGKQHVLKITPVIQKQHEGNVHHIILYQCIGATPAELNPYVKDNGYWCYHPGMPAVFGKCRQPYAAWGLGGEDVILPDHVGMPFGEQDTTYFMIELHYDNPHFKKDFLDHSGLRFYYTPNLREYDANTLMIGSEVQWEMFVPPGEENYVVAGHCDPRCLNPVLPPDGIKAMAVILHSHLLGRALRLRHFRNGTELPPIASDNHYDFNYQAYHYLKEEVPILPGDHLTTECVYDSRARNITTVGGLGTKQEMCLAYVLYYPQVNLHGCVSVPSSSTFKDIFGIELFGAFMIRAPEQYANQFLDSFLINYTWTNKTGVQELTRMGPHRARCFTDIHNELIYEPSTYPSITKPYEEPNQCKEVISVSGVHSKLHEHRNSSDATLKTSSKYVPLLFLFYLII